MKTMNNNYDRDLTPEDMKAAEATESRHAAQNILGLLQQREHIRKTRAKAIRAQYISPNDIF